MTNAIPSFLEGPTYLVVSKYKDGEIWIDETKMNATLEDAISDIENTHQVVLLEDGKVIDQSTEAAELWWKMNGQECTTMFDVPTFIHEHYREAYDDIAASKYNVRCQRDHENGLGLAERYL